MIVRDAELDIKAVNESGIAGGDGWAMSVVRKSYFGVV